MAPKSKTIFFLFNKITLSVFVFTQLFLTRMALPKQTRTATLTSASATLSNPRLSYYAKVSGAHTAGDNTILIQSSGNADNNTNHLFPNDTVSVGPNGGLTVSTIIDSTNFALSTGLTVGASDGDAVYATQSGSLTISFALASAIPANGYVKITIPDPASGGNDGAPDTGASTSVNGFDLNSMTTGDITVSGGTGCTWSGTETLTAGSGSGHTYQQITTTQCTGGTITVTFDNSPGLVNPAPISSGHTQGTADVYTITIETYDSSNQLIDNVDTAVAVVEGVLVSATIEESLAFSVAGVASGQSACGQTTDVTTTAYSIPYGALTAPSGFKEAAQLLTVSTNSDGGYAVRFYEDDELGKDGADTPYIPDTPCDSGPCTHTSSQEWNTSSNYGFGYSLANSSGTDAKFVYNESSRTFSAKQLPNISEGASQYSDTNAEIMSNSGPVSGSAVNICYRLSVSGSQEAGYYYNKVKYTATPIF